MGYEIYASSAFTAIGGFLFGYHTGVISGVLTMPIFICDLNINGTNKDVTNGGIVGVLLFGCFIGSLVSGQTSDRFSRKYSIIAFSIVFVMSAILQTTISNLGSFLFARFVAGEFCLFISFEKKKNEIKMLFSC